MTRGERIDIRRVDTGRRAEEIAWEYLHARGHKLLERNWRSGHKEIDLITSTVSIEGLERLHIVEVRSLNTPNLYFPYESIGVKKQRLIISAASSYIYHNKINLDTQFDIISVIFKPALVSVEYFPDAFAPTWR